jgi:hypothetical protein
VSNKTARSRSFARINRVIEKVRKKKTGLNPTWHKPPRFSIAVIDGHGDVVATITLPPRARK